MTSLNDLTQLCPPPHTAPAVDWQAVEDTLGMTLPDDYKQMASTYGPGAFCDFIRIYHPRSATPWVDLTGRMPTAIREQLRQAHDQGTYPVPHDPRHLFAIGVTDNGEYLFWITDPQDQPDTWRIAVNEARGPRWYTYDGTLTNFLTEVLTGRITVPLFPAGLLDHGVVFSSSPSAPDSNSPQPAPTAGGAVDTQTVREWARAQGYDVPDRGRVPAEIVTRWREAHNA
ncbi:histone-like nucleoid-structuring protein Lsr2 [Streptomyces sp. TRM49041]|uniref:Lsr2 family DNA-binding protein n=1 Tax=Streptomyces sp. TRM49041 TaxID=2603216 RepID=UPI00165684CD|nr:histone-like nucleoid-structuring protein Lsr2 [Streptomyces sp. TRM49041]